MDLLLQFLTNTGYYLADYRYFLMWGIGITFVYLAIGKQYEPLLLLPIGFGVLIGNVPFFKGFGLGIYEPNSVLHYLYFGVTTGVYPSIVFLGLGAMTEINAAGRSGANGHLFYPSQRLGPGFPAQRGRVDCHHRRRRRPHVHLLNRQAGTAPDRSHCHCCLLIHGFNSDYSTANHETADH